MTQHLRVSSANTRGRHGHAARWNCRSTTGGEGVLYVGRIAAWWLCIGARAADKESPRAKER